ncbi:hypothetical protein [Blastococcus montanus]|uniref:hypothetical protein n=1 Tax=Blastococcus montanus TaxID=3144973 RepID=UPI003208AF1C
MWTEHGPDDLHRRMIAPTNEIPVALPVNALLARTDDAAVALVGLHVYSTGLSFDLVVRVRGGVHPRDRLHDLMWSHGPGPGRFLLGVQFADGRRASTIGSPDKLDDGIVLNQGSGSGGELEVDQNWWLHPLPPEGPMRIVVRCAELGIEETVTELDGSSIRRAAGDVVELWPWTPPEPAREEREPRGPDVPPDSWFAGH